MQTLPRTAIPALKAQIIEHQEKTARLKMESIVQNAVALTARCMVRRALKGSLATRDRETGHPYASMILLATDVSGTPLSLLSQLARHTRNLAASSAASVMIDHSDAAGAPASGGRISLMGQLEPIDSTSTRARFLARHPEAAHYASFADFSFFAFEINWAHMIEGFGRIVPLTGAELLAPVSDSAAFAAAEPELLADLRRRWPAVTGFDSEGVDLRQGSTTERLLFDTPADEPLGAYKRSTERLAKTSITL